ncbi:MAG: cell division protein FtsL [Atopobiaceae bacterium]|nr:cell division protein FtsL [Atopobiaceae bacterium]
MYQGSAAYQLDANRNAWELPVSRPLSVYEGGGLDARNRADASSALIAVIKMAVVAMVMVFVLGAARVALTTQTVTLLGDISVAEGTVAQARVTRTELQVERSALSSADRIQRIATENYGMVFASDVDTVTINLEEDVPASADDAQSVDDADAAGTVA